MLWCTFSAQLHPPYWMWSTLLQPASPPAPLPRAPPPTSANLLITREEPKVIVPAWNPMARPGRWTTDVLLYFLLAKPTHAPTHARTFSRGADELVDRPSKLLFGRWDRGGDLTPPEEMGFPSPRDMSFFGWLGWTASPKVDWEVWTWGTTLPRHRGVSGHGIP